MHLECPAHTKTDVGLNSRRQSQERTAEQPISEGTLELDPSVSGNDSIPIVLFDESSFCSVLKDRHDRNRVRLIFFLVYIIEPSDQAAVWNDE